MPGESPNGTDDNMMNEMCAKLADLNTVTQYFLSDRCSIPPVQAMHDGLISKCSACSVYKSTFSLSETVLHLIL